MSGSVTKIESRFEAGASSGLSPLKESFLESFLWTDLNLSTTMASNDDLLLIAFGCGALGCNKSCVDSNLELTNGMFL